MEGELNGALLTSCLNVAEQVADLQLTVADVVFDVSGNELTLTQESELAKGLVEEYTGKTYEAKNDDEVVEIITKASGFCVQSVRTAAEEKGAN